MGNEKAAFAIIKISTTKGSPVDIYFEDEGGNRLKEVGESRVVDEWPLKVDAHVKFIDGAIWYASNPFCVWYDRRLI